MQVSGQLTSSISTHYDDDSAVIGLNLEYTTIHQLGGQTGWNKAVSIPTRPYLCLVVYDFQEMVNEIKHFLH